MYSTPVTVWSFIQPFYKYVLFAGGMQGLQSMMRQFQGAGGMPGGSGHN